MKTRAILFIIFTVALFALGVLITTVFNAAPTGRDAMLMFYVSAALFLFGLIFFGLYFFWWIRRQTPPTGLAVGAIARASLVADLFLLLILALRAGDVLIWATALVLLVAAFILTLILRRRLA